MKISINHLIRNYTDVNMHTKGTSAVHSISNTGHNFDAIIIQSDPRQVEERTFSEAVSKELLHAVSDDVSEEKVNSLQLQVAAGTYHIDSRSIASKILLLGEV